MYCEKKETIYNCTWSTADLTDKQTPVCENFNIQTHHSYLSTPDSKKDFYPHVPGQVIDQIVSILPYNSHTYYSLKMIFSQPFIGGHFLKRRHLWSCFFILALKVATFWNSCPNEFSTQFWEWFTNENTFSYEIQNCPNDFKSNSLDHHMDTTENLRKKPDQLQ